MFTGIVDELASVVSVAKRPGKNTSIKVKLGKSAKGVMMGDSVCVNGVCLVPRPNTL